MTTVTEAGYAGDAILSEANGTLSREKVTIKSGENLAAGTVLGKITVGAATAAAVAGNTGTGTVGAITVSAGAKSGVYKLTIIEPGTDAGKFVVEDPDGITIGSGTVAAAFSAGGLAFTLSDATDFVAGDAFNITVAVGAGKYVQLDLDATDGSQRAAGVLYAAVDATSADARGTAVVRLAELKTGELVWPTGITTDQKAAAVVELAALTLIVRD